METKRYSCNNPVAQKFYSFVFPMYIQTRLKQPVNENVKKMTLKGRWLFNTDQSAKNFEIAEQCDS